MALRQRPPVGMNFLMAARDAGESYLFADSVFPITFDLLPDSSAVQHSSG